MPPAGYGQVPRHHQPGTPRSQCVGEEVGTFIAWVGDYKQHLPALLPVIIADAFQVSDSDRLMTCWPTSGRSLARMNTCPAGSSPPAPSGSSVKRKERISKVVAVGRTGSTSG